jgi:hypothetical protein
MTTVPPRGALVCVLGSLLAATLGGTVRAEEREAAHIDSENLFGFLTGTDVGEAGERELESETTAHLGRRTGRYRQLGQTLGLEFTPIDHLRLEPDVVLGYHDIAGVPGLDDLQQGAFQGLSFEARYQLIERRAAGFGLTLFAEPQWARIDETSGQPVDRYSADLAVLVDKELIPDRIIAAFNLLYEPGATRSRPTGAWSHDATLGVGTAVMARVQGDFFVGAEARYLRAYDSLGLADFAGEALFVGPNIFFKPTDAWRITATWSFQVAGKAARDPGALDLTNFERQQLLLRIAYEF